jgi:ribosomal protein S18 acetylase RimI-like enzyme
MATVSLQAPACTLVPASAFSIEQLTAAYNQTRVDYLVPMPMNAARLADYIRLYDVDLDQSLVAVDKDTVLGLAMLGVRPGCAWVTRLGVLPGKRRGGVGESLVCGLLERVVRAGIDLTGLEVIKNNTPAHRLFLKLGFQETRELLVLLRPPGPPAEPPPAEMRWLGDDEALRLLETRCEPAAWTNQTESFANAQHVLGLSVELPDGGRGWLVFQRQKFVIQRLALATEQCDPRVMARALLTCLYLHHPLFDSHIENIPVDDPHLSALLDAGFVESFRRIEMHRFNHL